MILLAGWVRRISPSVSALPVTVIDSLAGGSAGMLAGTLGSADQAARQASARAVQGRERGSRNGATAVMGNVGGYEDGEVSPLCFVRSVCKSFQIVKTVLAWRW